ncbi:MAG TPA: tetratricopeptide repeat protein [Pyrinomonadaceae bacterium]|nr:tetratricopeptide repeat protein [Pyrinomonadaceae bacterium]
MSLFLSVVLGLAYSWIGEAPRLEAGAFIQQNTNSISGHVSDDRRAPVKDLRVELLNEVDTVLQTAKTDGSGLFIFRKLSDGTFQIRVRGEGTSYESEVKRVELTRPHGLGAASEEVDIVLRLRRTTSVTAKGGVVFVQEVPESARKEFQRASDLLQKSEKSQEARAALKKAIEIYPQYFEALETLGSEHVKQQEYELALPILTKATEINARAFPSWYALGVAQFNLKQMPAAVESFRRALLLNDKSINSHLFLGMTLRQTARLDEAETHLKQANLLAENKLPDVHWQLALLYNQLKRYGEAADELELFLKVQPDARDAQQIRKLIQKFRQQSSTGTSQDRNRP